jgi:hypothetical protein
MAAQVFYRFFCHDRFCPRNSPGVWHTRCVVHTMITGLLAHAWKAVIAHLPFDAILAFDM